MLLTRQEIQIGNWYRMPDGDVFEVVALEADRGLLEIQYFDGTVEELGIDNCLLGGIKASAPPEDYTGSLDIEREDYGVEFADTTAGSSWDDPLDALDQM